MNKFQKLLMLSEEAYNLNNVLEEYIEDYLINNYPYGDKKGEICPNEWSWEYYLEENIVKITYCVWLDNYQDRYSEEKEMWIPTQDIFDNAYNTGMIEIEDTEEIDSDNFDFANKNKRKEFGF